MEITARIIGIVVACAASVAGIIEWIKAGIELFNRPKEERTLKVILPWILLPFASFGAACCFDGGLFVILPIFVMAWAVTQLAYPILIKLPVEILALLKKKLDKLGE